MNFSKKIETKLTNTLNDLIESDVFSFPPPKGHISFMHGKHHVVANFDNHPTVAHVLHPDGKISKHPISANDDLPRVEMEQHIKQHLTNKGIN